MGSRPEIRSEPAAPERAPDPAAPGAELFQGVRTVLGLPPEEARAALERWPKELGLSLYRAMARLRAFDERAVTLQRQGRIGTYPTFYGEEAVQAASVLALDARDWLFPTYRQTAVVTLRGCPAAVPLLMWRGHPAGWHDVMRYRVAPICVPVATNLPHAVGAAWGSALLKEPVVTLGYGGDGATSAGDFHEALNLAAVVAAPVVFLINNNQWAISTPLRRQTRVARLADKALAYGIPAIRVDGFDVFACHEAVSEAAQRARSGGGPTLIEAAAYRLGPHGTADEPSLYRPDDEVRLWEPMEPLRRCELALVLAGHATAAELQAIRAQAHSDLRDVGAELERVPPVTVEEIAETVHRETPWGLRPDRLREPAWVLEGSSPD